MFRWLRLATLLLVMVGGFVVANGAMAQGLVPACPVEGACEREYAPQNYGTCELVVLGNNVIRFIIGLVSVLAAVVMVYAGYLLVTSRGNVSAMQRAKEMFTNILIGLLIALSAFLVVNTVMQMLVRSDGPLVTWDQIECSYASQTGQAQTRTIALRDYTSGLDFSAVEGTVTVIGGAGSDRLVGGVSVNELRSASGACSPALVSRVWGQQAANAQCIIRAESSCGASPISRSDIGADRNPFSFGAMQINTTVHVVRGCGGLGIRDLNCMDAWSGRNYGARVINPSLYQACRSALLNNECNMINGRRIYQEAGNSWRPWSTARMCGLAR